MSETLAPTTAPPEGDETPGWYEGRNLTILELNGVTSESTDIYDPKNGLLAAYRILRRQWRLAFAIGARNRAAGAETTGLLALARLAWFRGR